MKQGHIRSVGLASAIALVCGLAGGTAAHAVDPPATGPTPATGSTTYRLAGGDRYETAVKISQQWYAVKRTERPNTVYVASGENFPDALSAAPIAGLNRAPLLLTPAGTLPAIVKTEIERLKPKRIVVVGGPSAVSTAVENQLAPLASRVVRVAGTDRYQTSREVIRYGMLTNPDFATVTKDAATGKYTRGALTAGFLGTDADGTKWDITAGLPQLRFYMATGRNFPDALAIGAIGGNWLGAYPGPVFLEDGEASSVSQDTVKLMSDLLDVWGPDTVPLDTYIIGGTAAMSPAVMKSAQTAATTVAAGRVQDAGKVIRIGGSDRYETSRLIVEKLKKVYTKQTTPFDAPTQGVFATGTNFPDALAGSAYAAASNSALWVIPPACVPGGVWATANKLKLTTYALLGGTSALLPAVDTLTTCS